MPFQAGARWVLRAGIESRRRALQHFGRAMNEPSPSLAELSACLLDLHEQAPAHDFRPMQRFALARTKTTLPFAAGLLAQGTVTNGIPVAYDVLLEGRPPEFMESWERVKANDVAAHRATGNPGTTVNVDVNGPLFEACPDVRAHCRTYGIGHILCTALVSPMAGLFWVMSLYRESEFPFTEHERRAKEALTPHLFAAIRQARLGQLRRAAQLSELHGQVAAITTREGIVLEAEPGFGELLATRWHGWQGPALPSELRLAHGRGRTTTLFDSVVANLAPADDVVLVHLRRPLPADDLTGRQLEIARAFSIGDTHRAIGERLGISPNTVRRHLANIYEKLGISSKAELDRMISGVS